MDYFSVVIEQLRPLAYQLDDCGDRLRTAMSRLEELGPGRLGTDGMDDACHDLQRNWKAAVAKIDELSRHLAMALRDTASTYRTSDDDVAAGTPIGGTVRPESVRLHQRLGGVQP